MNRILTMKKNELATMERGGLVDQAEVEVCNRLHTVAAGLAEEARLTAERACHYAVVLGLRLKRLKEQTPHGGWMGLFANGKEANSKHVLNFGFSDQTARNYIRAAEGAINRPGLPVAKRKAIEALAAADTTELGNDHHEVLDLATRGGTLRQLYLDLGVIRAGATEKRTERTPGPGGKKPLISEEDDIYLALAEHTNAITKLINAGKLSLLSPAKVRQFLETWQSFVDDAKPLAK